MNRLMKKLLCLHKNLKLWMKMRQSQLKLKMMKLLSQGRSHRISAALLMVNLRQVVLQLQPQVRRADHGNEKDYNFSTRIIKHC